MKTFSCTWIHQTDLWMSRLTNLRVFDSTTFSTHKTTECMGKISNIITALDFAYEFEFVSFMTLLLINMKLVSLLYKND